MGRRNTDATLRLQAGKLRHLATIESPVRSQTESGDVVKSFSTVASAYISIRPLTGRELWNAQQMQADMSHEIVMRYTPGVTSDMTVVYDGRRYEIAEPPENVDERNIVLRLLCIKRG